MDNIHFDELSNKGDIYVRLYLATIATPNFIYPKIKDQDLGELEKTEWINNIKC